MAEKNTAGAGERSLTNWSALARLRKEMADDPKALDRFREDPVRSLQDAGFNLDEPFVGPGVEGVTLREVVEKTPGIEKMLPMIVGSAADALEAYSSGVKTGEGAASATSAKTPALLANANANANANGNGNGNGNANANANGDDVPTVQSSAMWDRNKRLTDPGTFVKPATWPAERRAEFLSNPAYNFRLLKMSETKVLSLIERVANDPTRKLYEKELGDGVREGFEHLHGENVVEVRVKITAEGSRVIESASVRPA